MTNNGVEAPGVALSVEPMVEIPVQYRHQPAGTFLLTSVIQQSPIPAGVWLAGQITPVLNILPPEKIVKNQISPQENARQGFQMLDQSVTTASVVGLRLAGFDAVEIGKGAGVVSILAESTAQGVLLPGDIITEVNGMPVHTANDLIDLVKTQDPLAKLHLSILREQHSQEFNLSMMSPAKAWRSAAHRYPGSGCRLRNHPADPGQNRAAKDRRRPIGRADVYPDPLQYAFSQAI